jgi:hypothetical protein
MSNGFSVAGHQLLKGIMSCMVGVLISYGMLYYSLENNLSVAAKLMQNAFLAATINLG